MNDEDDDEETGEGDSYPTLKSVRRRSSSCPDQHEISIILKKRKELLFRGSFKNAILSDLHSKIPSFALQVTPNEPVCSPKLISTDSSDGNKSNFQDEGREHSDAVVSNPSSINSSQNHGLVTLKISDRILSNR